MSRPIRKQSHVDAQATGPGEAHGAKGHNSLGLLVVAKSADTVNDTVDVRLEVEGADGEWAPIHDKDGNQVGSLTIADLTNADGSANDKGFLYVHGVPAPRVRANITGFTDAGGEGDLAVDTYILGANNGGTGHDYH